MSGEPENVKQKWEWSYSRWVGVMYGPVPVGVIVVAIGYGGYIAFGQ